MKNKKFLILALSILAVGFAAVSTTLYITVGGQGSYFTGTGSNSCDTTYRGGGGYNGGGGARTGSQGGAGGGGATHIATRSGLLSTLSSYVSDILIVSGGGGGSSSTTGSSAGGFVGNNGYDGWVVSYPQYSPGFIGTGGSQTAGGYSYDYGTKNTLGVGGFGYGGTQSGTDSCGSHGGGAGFYGGGASRREHGTAGGGSGYIGNSKLTNKVMYCYNCSTSNVESTKTVSNTCGSSTATSNCSKKGNGYAKITLVSID